MKKNEDNIVIQCESCDSGYYCKLLNPYKCENFNPTISSNFFTDITINNELINNELINYHIMLQVR